MSPPTAVPVLHQIEPNDNPEHYELIGDKWEKKQSVGRKEHSKMGRLIYRLLKPQAQQLGSKIDLEWTVLRGEKKLVPDVTLSRPAPQDQECDGYLLAPALLVVESRSRGQRLQSLIDKCLHDHHAMGTRYCWIVDIEQEIAYECHQEVGAAIVVPVLRAGNIPSLSLEVARLFVEFRAED